MDQPWPRDYTRTWGHKVSEVRHIHFWLAVYITCICNFSKKHHARCFLFEDMDILNAIEAYQGIVVDHIALSALTCQLPQPFLTGETCWLLL